MDFLALLKSKSFVENWTVLSHRVWTSGFYYKIKISLKDSSFLQATEYNDEEERNYSFHWQSAEGKLLIRCDNAPHHKNISTFPHHKHILDKVEMSLEMTLEEALNEIERLLNIT
jgi:hypothetical protein